MTNVMTRMNARGKILNYLAQHNGASSLEISRALDVTPANVRHHLSILVADGRAQVLGLRAEQAAGRPVKAYGLGEAAQGENLAGLVNAMLDLFLRGMDEAGRENVLKELADGLVAFPVGDRGLHITRRLAGVIARINQVGYMARWEAHAVAPRIILEHCPYAAVIGQHPELCKMDQFLLSQQVNGNVEQTSKLERNARGTTFCQFELR